VSGPAGDTQRLLEKNRKRIPGPLRLKPLPIKPVSKPSTTPGTLGINDAAESIGRPKTFPPLEVHLDLIELVELNEVIEHGRSGLIKKGKAFANDPKRPQMVLAIVASLFSPLGKAIHICLGSGAKSDRFLKAAFSWGMDPDIGGASAKGISRSKLGNFNRMGDDQGKPVTAYIFEGVIGNWIVEYLGGKCSNVANLFAAITAHELGHQLGLDHIQSIQNVMFNFRDGSRADRTKWLQSCEKNELTFEPNQINAMKTLLLKI
jgi:hypothetical protein